MRAIGELLTGPTAAPAIVLGAVVHAEIATVAPFGAASGLVARAAEHLVLISAGVDPLGVIVVEAGHRDRPGYRAALAAYAEGRVRGVGDWIIRCAEAVSRGAERSPAVTAENRPARDAAPTGVGAVPGTTSASDQACCFNALAQVKPDAQLPVWDG